MGRREQDLRRQDLRFGQIGALIRRVAGDKKARATDFLLSGNRTRGGQGGLVARTPEQMADWAKMMSALHNADPAMLPAWAIGPQPRN